MTMSTKTNAATVVAFLTVLAAPGFASAQEGFGNYASAQAASGAYPGQQVNQPNVRALAGTFGSANKSVHVKRAATVSQR
jgi:hypothetical protein